MAQGKHSLIYLLGRGLPGLINFVAISIYTRLISPEEYGKYALVIATVSLFNMVLFQWIRLSLLRFLPKSTLADEKKRLFSSIAFGFLIACLISTCFGIGYCLIWKPEPPLIRLLVIGLFLLFMEAFFELNIEYFRSNLNPRTYSIAFVAKSVAAIVAGSSLAWFRFGAIGLIEGIAIADVLVLFLFFREFTGKLITSFRSFDKMYSYGLLKYGLPLTASFAMTFIINSSDRYFISYYLGDAATGKYAVGYDLSRQSLWVIMTSINLASFPLVVRAFEKQGKVEASKQLESNLILLLAISVPAALGMACLSKLIAAIFVGKQFSQEVALIIPYISIGTLIAGLKNFYFDQSFQLGNKTYLQIWSVIAAGVVNIVLNILWIPKIGVMGAIYSTVICFIISLMISIAFTKKSFVMPLPWAKMLKITFASLIMATVILLLGNYFFGVIGLIILMVIAIITYGCFLVLFKIINFDNIKKVIY